MDHVRSLGDDVHVIDTRMSGYTGSRPATSSRRHRPCLVETGTATSAPRCATRWPRSASARDDLATIVVTHIHLDHAGGVGDLAARLSPRRGRRSTSAARGTWPTRPADGQRTAGLRRRCWTTCSACCEPTDAARIRALGDVGAIDLGGGRHARRRSTPRATRQHHVGLVDSRDRRPLRRATPPASTSPRPRDLRPSTPPPDFDLDLAVASLRAIPRRGADAAAVQPLRAGRRRAATLERAEESCGCGSSDVREPAPTRSTWTTPSRWSPSGPPSATRAPRRPGAAEKFEHLNATAANVVGISLARPVDGADAGWRRSQLLSRRARRRSVDSSSARRRARRS